MPPGDLGLEVGFPEHDLWKVPELAPEADLSSSSPLSANPLLWSSELGIAEVLRLAISSTREPVVMGLKDNSRSNSNVNVSVLPPLSVSLM